MSLATSGNVGWTLVGDQARYSFPDSIAGNSSMTTTIILTVDSTASSATLNNEAEVSFADNDSDPNNPLPIEFDSDLDTIPSNDFFGGDNIIDGSGGDEDDHDRAAVPLVTIDPTANITEAGCNFPTCLLYTSPSPRDQRGSRMPSSA